MKSTLYVALTVRNELDMHDAMERSAEIPFEFPETYVPEFLEVRRMKTGNGLLYVPVWPFKIGLHDNRF